MMWLVYGIGIIFILMIAKRVFEDWLYQYKLKDKKEVSFNELSEMLLTHTQLHIYIEKITSYRDALEHDKHTIRVNGFIELCEKCIPRFANVNITVSNSTSTAYTVGSIRYKNDRFISTYDVPSFTIEIYNILVYEELLQLVNSPSPIIYTKQLNQFHSRERIVQQAKQTLDIFYKKDELQQEFNKSFGEEVVQEFSHNKEACFLITNVCVNQNFAF